MKTLHVLAGIAAFAVCVTPALAQHSSGAKPTPQDALQLQRVAQDADELAAGGVADDASRRLVDEIDQAWNSVADVYSPLDQPASFAGWPPGGYTEMDERVSILNSTLLYGDAGGGPQTAADVAAWARHLLDITKSDR